MKTRASKKGLCPHNRPLQGFSLVELLIGIALSSLILFGLYGVLSSQERIYSMQDDLSEMQQNLRLAMERITRDLTMAGFGKPSRLGTPAWPLLNGIAGLDFSVRVTGSNALDIVGCLDPPEGQSASGLAVGSTSITLGPGEGANFNTTTKGDISVGGKENAKIRSVVGDTLAIDTNPSLAGNQGLVYGYMSGVPIYTVKYVTYSVDRSNPNEPVLRVDEHRGAGRQQVAQYVDIVGATLTGNLLDVILTGRSKRPDRGTNQYARVQIENGVFLRNLANSPK
jgi:prepilin-type N-terminal cleavage/methylation domain-containing protein